MRKNPNDQCSFFHQISEHWVHCSNFGYYTCLVAQENVLRYWWEALLSYGYCHLLRQQECYIVDKEPFSSWQVQIHWSKYNFTRDMVSKQKIEVKYFSSKDLFDVFTKWITKAQFFKLSDSFVGPLIIMGENVGMPMLMKEEDKFQFHCSPYCVLHKCQPGFSLLVNPIHGVRYSFQFRIWW